jgi:hypothetical protein
MSPDTAKTIAKYGLKDIDMGCIVRIRTPMVHKRRRYEDFNRSSTLGSRWRGLCELHHQYHYLPERQDGLLYHLLLQRELQH